MKITKLIVKNIRSFKEQMIFEINSNYVTFTGENNCGKSNVLRSLNLFFNGIVDKSKFNSQTDMHLDTINEGSRERTNITVHFELDERKDRIIIQQLDKLTGSGIINDYSLNNLQLSLTYTSANIPQVQFISPATGRRTQSNEITEFFNNTIKRSINFVYIPAVKDLSQFIDKDVSIELLKRIFNTWGRSRNPQAQELKNRFETIKSNISEIIDSASDNITSIINEQTRETYEFIFNLPFKDLIDFLSYLPIAINDTEITPINLKGSGIQALTLYSLIRYLDKYRPTNKYSNAQLIWAIEEPETFLHPKAQQNLYKALIEYSNDTQIFITTHSYYFLNTIDLKSNFLLIKNNVLNNKYSQTEILSEAENQWQPFIRILGDYTPSFIPPSDFDKVYIFCEGKIDIRYIEQAIKFNNDLETFYNTHVIFMDGNGSQIAQKAFEAKVIYKLKVMAIVDGDSDGNKYFTSLISKGFIQNMDVFKLEITDIPEPNIEAVVARLKLNSFIEAMPPEAKNYWQGSRKMQLWGSLERPPEGWNKDSFKSKLCDYLIENGEEEDYRELLSLLSTVKNSVNLLINGA